MLAQECPPVALTFHVLKPQQDRCDHHRVEKAWNAAWDMQRLLENPSADPVSELFGPLRDALNSASNDFTEAVRNDAR
jgi:hypothetical protein